eukprot:TRINITY_DN13025_c0_g1_i1.p1 TRINITY_DN13025_c0_g1~~TRINITY_DN13025_c0_g1_i1.p1  ORF type:complete len:275 (+),score=49.05 TRINITY_DN13025_c0_g1_i1:185-1009(+)
MKEERHDIRKHLESMPVTNGKLQFTRYLKSSVPTNDRFVINSMAHLQKRRDKLEKSTRFCSNCWHVVECCMCSYVENSDVRFQASYIVYTHYKEFGRTSNTGRFLELVSPSSFRIVYCGDIDGEQDIIDSMKNDPTHCFILYPGNDSITFEELAERNGHALGQDLGMYTVIILDGTWTQVKSLRKRINVTESNIPFIKLANFRDPESQLRKETEPNRTSTAEAVGMLLEEMHETQESVDAFWTALKAKFETAHKQLGKTKGKPPQPDQTPETTN